MWLKRTPDIVAKDLDASLQFPGVIALAFMWLCH